jgi:hypothetical protein
VDKNRYIVTQLNTSGSSLEEKDAILVGPYSVNNTFNSSKDFIDLHIYSLEDQLIKSQLNYKGAAQSVLAAGAGQEGASNIQVSPYEDAVANGFTNGDVKLVYNFFTDLLLNKPVPSRFFIESISSDRTELQLLTLEIPDENIPALVTTAQTKLLEQSYFSDFKLNFGKNNLVSAINIASLEYKGGASVVVKLYEALPNTISIKDTCTILEPVSDSATFRVELTEVVEEIKVPYLKGPNFEIELQKENDNPTEFFNYDELFSFPVTGSYYQLYSLFNEKGAQISINHEDYTDFIHFSSAEERLRNFKYKLDLINSYEDSKKIVKDTGYTQLGASGSAEYYENLIQGIVKNFDHYDRYLFYESGSFSWPKSNNKVPYTNQKSSTTESITWFEQQLTSASNFDVTNYDVLTNAIPSYLREDSANEPLLMFVHMLGQHFDNLWIYFKAVSNKYDADNRLNFGISKDIVRSAVESFGVKLFNSNRNLENLFSTYTGESYNSASTGEIISTYRQITSGSGLEHLQPMPLDNYQKEIYKRIYHNIPLLTKAKGTHRGLRALINCYGIPDDILTIKQFGGTAIDSNRHFSSQQAVTSSLDKIRLDNTGSLVSGSTLSPFTSIVDRTYVYSDDVHTVEVGFDISDTTNDIIQTRLSSSFDYDQYIGDPRDNFNTEYYSLRKLSEAVIGGEQEGSVLNFWNNVTENWENANWNWNDAPFSSFRSTTDFIRLVKFFDNSIFRMIKEFVPARSNVNTGVVIKSHLLHRSKIKQVEVSFENKIYTGSLTIDPITGSHAGAFDITSKTPFTTNHLASFMSPLGLVPRHVTDESPKYTGAFSGSLLIASDGELNKANPFKGQAQPVASFSLRAFNFSLPIPLACDIVLQVTKLGEFFRFTPIGPGTVGITYPNTVPVSSNTISSSIDYNIYQFLQAVASPIYPYYFEGWYDQDDANTGTLIQTGSSLSVFETMTPSVEHYYAHFSTDPANRVVYFASTRYTDGTPDGTAYPGSYGTADSIELIYPTTIPSTGSMVFTQNWNAYGQFQLNALDDYGGNDFVFQGWYNASNTLLTLSNTLTVTEGAFGDVRQFYALYD